MTQLSREVEQCCVCVRQMDAVGGSADLELCDHIISFINAALTSPEAQSNLPLRKRFVNALLDRGLRTSQSLYIA